MELEPISLSLPQLKELGAKWLVDMFKHIPDNPQMIVNGFIKSGISLDGMELQDDSDNGAGSGADDASSDDSEDEFED